MWGVFSVSKATGSREWHLFRESFFRNIWRNLCPTGDLLTPADVGSTGDRFFHFGVTAAENGNRWKRYQLTEASL